MTRALLGAVLLACSPGAPEGKAPAEAKVPTEGKATSVEGKGPAEAEGKAPSEDKGPAEGKVPVEGKAPADVLAKICAKATCAGPFGRVEVLRKEGAIVGYLHFGDLRRCSHPPAVYFDAAGEELGAIPEKPVAPGSDEARHFEAERVRLSRGGVAAESLSCPEG